MAGDKIDKGPGTRDRALEAAEQIFIRHGYEGTSLRAIANAAKVNLGSLVYHFATKERLFRSLCEERLSAIIARQVTGLRACGARLEAGEAVTLEDVIRVVVAPALPNGDASGRLRGLYARVFTDPSDAVVAVGNDMFGEASQLLYGLARSLLAELDASEFHWRYVGALGALVVTQGFAERMGAFREAPQPEMPMEQRIEAIIGVIVRGLGG